MIVTERPLSAAQHADARPAGPPPIIRMSQSLLTLSISSYVHSISAWYLATLSMALVVDRHSTFKTDTHSAQWSASLACNRASKRCRASDHNCGRYHRSFRHRYRDAIYRERDFR